MESCERSGIFQILILNCVGQTIRERAEWARWIVSRIMRVDTGANYKQIRYIPALQMIVHDAGARIGPHDRAACVVRRLIRDERKIFMRHIWRCDVGGIHRFPDFVCFLQREIPGLEVILSKIVSQAHQWLPKSILVGRIEIAIRISVWHVAGTRCEHHRALIPMCGRPLPF